MPGILPMKVIKVGTSAQSRIAQACDRCRSKKIRCDGFRPTCTQCSNVGFECKTSDKLSRRAFPRGYTESLEERVRVLEGETRELKDLLDERDEKIEMLSKMHAHSPRRSTSSRRPSSIISTTEKGQMLQTLQQEKDSLFKLQQSPYLLSGANTDLYFMGNSSSRSFVVSFKRKLQESGKSCSDFKVDPFFSHPPESVLPPHLTSNDALLFQPPSRLHSDQMVNIFFQEWAPLFPVVHRPAFLALYEQYVSNAANVQDKKSLAQLNLVFGIAALSNETRIAHNAELCERQWTVALDSFIKETSMSTLQCLVLAQIYCIQKGDFDRLIHYKGLAVAIAQRLGLHLSQKRFALGVLTVETRKKVFWSLYAIDCFSSALLGLPKSLREEDIYCEYPVDADDEYVTEKGFQPTLPGEFTKLSSALALFRGCRIMAKVLEQNYPCAASHELSLQNIANLNEELETWSHELPTHLKLEFVQDKPSTNTISSRSPLLSLTYNFIRILIHRPAICANLGERATSSAVALSSANKQIIQVIELLEERNLSFSFCLNKSELLLSAGVGLLFQSLELDDRSKMMRDIQKSICAVIQMLEARNTPGAHDFKHLSCAMLSLTPSRTPVPPQIKENPKKSRSMTMSSPEDVGACHTQLAALAARYTLAANQPQAKSSSRDSQSRRSESAISPMQTDKPSRRPSEKTLRTLAPSIPGHKKSHTTTPTGSESSKSASKHGRHRNSQPLLSPRTSIPNLDYFAFSDESDAPGQPRKEMDDAVDDTAIWDTLLHLETQDFSNLNGTSDSVYDWPPMDSMLSPNHLESAPPTKYGSDTAWSPDVWNMSSQHQPQSVLSFSDESLTSGEDFSSCDFGSTKSDSIFKTVSIPQMTPEEFSPTAMQGFDGSD